MYRNARVGSAPRAAGAGRFRIIRTRELNKDALDRDLQRVGGDLRRNGIGPGADVGHVAADDDAPVGLQTYARSRRALKMHADRRSHAVADEPGTSRRLPGLIGR